MTAKKTTVYLPDDLKAAVKRAAARRGVSEAEVIRQSIRKMVGEARPRPRGGLFAGQQAIARRADDLPVGFGGRRPVYGTRPMTRRGGRFHQSGAEASTCSIMSSSTVS